MTTIATTPEDLGQPARFSGLNVQYKYKDFATQPAFRTFRLVESKQESFTRSQKKDPRKTHTLSKIRMNLI